MRPRVGRTDMTNSRNEAVCRVCDEPISTGADQCPYCGHKGSRHTPLEPLARRFFYACILCIFVVTAPIGLPLMVWYSFRMTVAKRRHPEWTRPAVERGEAA